MHPWDHEVAEEIDRADPIASVEPRPTLRMGSTVRPPLTPSSGRCR